MPQVKKKRGTQKKKSTQGYLRKYQPPTRQRFAAGIEKQELGRRNAKPRRLERCGTGRAWSLTFTCPSSTTSINSNTTKISSRKCCRVTCKEAKTGQSSTSCGSGKQWGLGGQSQCSKVRLAIGLENRSGENAC